MATIHVFVIHMGTYQENKLPKTFTNYFNNTVKSLPGVCDKHIMKRISKYQKLHRENIFGAIYMYLIDKP